LYEWLVFLISVVPFLELRFSIPLAIGMGYNPAFAFFICVLLNMLAIPITFILLDFIIPPIRRRVGLVERMFKWSLKRATKNQNLGLVGLAVFVGVPLPLTGAYTGSLIAYVAGMNRKHAAVAIAAGVIMAGVLVWALAALGLMFIQGISPS
jgi:uncharacterized membrane protein